MELDLDDDPFNAVVNLPLRQATTAIEDNPDDASRSLELSRSSGVPAPIIQADLSGFEQVHRQSLTNQILRSNPKLIDYVRSHPMAASVSNDDWGNLAEVSQAGSQLHKLLALDPMRGALHGMFKGAAEGFTAKTTLEKEIDKWYADRPLTWALMSAGWFPFTTIERTFHTLMEGQFGAVRGGAETAYKAVTGDVDGAEDFGRGAVEVASIALAGVMAEPMMIPSAAFGKAVRQQEALKAATPWLEADLTPPRGVHSLIDQALGDANREAVTRLDEIYNAAQKSSTRERSLEMFRNFTAQEHGSTTLNVHGPAVAELYGDRVPTVDDGLLGFVPGIGDQLLAAHLSGSDVVVPIKDWLSQVQPEVAARLHDDLRMFPNGITARELVEPLEPKVTLDAPLAQVRAVAGLEPKFALGDRKLILEADLTLKDFETFKREFGADVTPERFTELSAELKDQDRYFMKDSTGKTVAELHLFPDVEAKELYVDWIGAPNKLGLPVNIGPAAVRDILRQLKEKYPGYTLTGERVSGARPVPGKPKVKLNLDSVLESGNLRETDKFWRQLSENVFVKAADAADTIVHQELRRMVGLEPKLLAAEAIRAPTPTGIRVQGLYQPYRNAQSVIVWNALNPNRLGVARHEGIHYLRDFGFFTAEEWTALSWHALQGEWVKKHNVQERYPHLGPESQIEEAIAEGYREWADTAIAPRPVVGVFQRMKDLWLSIKSGLRRFFGEDVNVEELLQSIHSGRIAKRGPGRIAAQDLSKYSSDIEIISALRKLESGPGNFVRFDQLRGEIPGVLDQDIIELGKQGKVILARYGGPEPELEKLPHLLKDPNPSDPSHPYYIAAAIPRDEPKFSFTEADFDNLKAQASGLDATSYKRIKDSIKSRYESDLVAAVNLAEAQQRHRQTAEWKSKSAVVQAEVDRTVRQRPDVAADLFINSGEYQGQKLRQRIPLRASDLSAEQKAALPKAYYAKTGLPVDDVARLFGYADGSELVERLMRVSEERGRRTPQEYLRDLILTETEQRMERQHGRLEDNIMEAASDQALSETDVNLLIDEYHAAGMLSGQATIDKKTIQAQAQDAFSKLPIGSISSQRLMSEIGRHDRDAERALIADDNVGALKSMEHKVYASMLAAEARKLEKSIRQFDLRAGELSVREKKGLPQPYLNFIHQILSQVGKPVRRPMADLKNEIANHAAPSTLEAFAEELSAGGQEVVVWDKLFDSTWNKPYRELTTEEFHAVQGSVDNLRHIGRAVGKIEREGAAADLNSMVDRLVDSLRDFSVQHYDIRGESPLRTHLPRTMVASVLTLETLFGRFDRFNPFGDWTQWALRGLIEGSQGEGVMMKSVARKLREIYVADDLSLKDPIPNTLFRDTVGGDLHRFTRENLRAVMLNTGSRGHRLSNLTYLAKGHGLDEAKVLEWIDQHATKADWDWAQKIWDLFRDELWEPAQRMQRSLSGVAAKSLVVPPIETPFGTYRGGYYPVMKVDHVQSGKSLVEGLFGPDFVRATTWDGYAMQRTGAYAPLNLSLNPMSNRIGQIIHDINLRPAVIQAGKIFYHKDIYAAIKRYYGKESAELLIPYLKDVAGTANYKSYTQQVFEKYMNAMQKNLVVSLIGLNIGTFMKHTPTAWVLSMREVGPIDFLSAVKSMHSINEATGQSNWRFIYDKLEELQNRDRNWMETLTGTSQEFIPGQSMGLWRQRIAQWAVKPIAYGDMISAAPTGLAVYWRAIREGKSEGDAVWLANRAVRRAHGSSAITNRAQVQRALPAAVTAFYTFFNDILNRQAELVWRAADALGVTGKHTWAQARAEIIPIASGLFATVLWPAIVEQLVTPLGKPEDSWEKKAGLAVAHTLTASWPIVRDFASWFIGGHDPALGLYTTAAHELGDIFKDLGKDQPLSREHAGKVIKDSAAFVGLLSGYVPLAVGKAGQFAYGTYVGKEHPRGPWGWATGMRYGTLKGHSGTVEQWLKGRGGH